jgi:hypothetical protein
MATLRDGFRALGACCTSMALVVAPAGCGSSSQGVENAGVGPAADTGDGGGASTTENANDGGVTHPSSDDGSSPGTPGAMTGEGGAGNDTPDAVPGPDAAAIEPDAGADGGPESSPCAGGSAGVASDAMGAKSTPVSSYGAVEFNIATQTQIVGLHTTLTVPAKPPPSGTLFLWPGLQPLPGGKNYNPIGNGVLQPVLTWGGTCAPTAPNSYDSWWISGQYVNTYGSDQGHTGCHGGQGMDVGVGDQLDIAMTLKATSWNQTIVDRQTGHTATFDFDMAGQAQDWAIFTIESDGSEPISDVVFTSTTLTLADADGAGCQPSTRGQDDYFSAPQTSTDGKTCCVSKIILRAKGVAATTPNTP